MQLLVERYALKFDIIYLFIYINFLQGCPFLYHQIKDNINPHQTHHLIHALCRWDERLANQITTMLFASVTKHTVNTIDKLRVALQDYHVFHN